MRKAAPTVVPFLGLFALLARLRGASASSLHELFFRRALDEPSTRTTERHIADLVTERYLARYELDAGRSIYHMTRRSLGVLEDRGQAVNETLRREPSFDVARRVWLRSVMHAALSRRGFSVERGPRAVLHLRRWYVDGQRKRRDVLSGREREEAQALVDLLRAEPSLLPASVAFCSRCRSSTRPGVGAPKCSGCGGATELQAPHRLYRCRDCRALLLVPGPHAGNGRPCKGLAAEVENVAHDVASRTTAAGGEVVVLFVDAPRLALAAQLEKFPAQIIGAPPLPVILRSIDPDSRYDLRRREWASKGSKHRALLRAFSAEPREDLFPFALTTKVIEPFPDLQLNVLR